MAETPGVKLPVKNLVYGIQTAKQIKDMGGLGVMYVAIEGISLVENSLSGLGVGSDRTKTAEVVLVDLEEQLKGYHTAP